LEVFVFITTVVPPLSNSRSKTSRAVAGVASIDKVRAETNPTIQVATSSSEFATSLPPWRTRSASQRLAIQGLTSKFEASSPLRHISQQPQRFIRNRLYGQCRSLAMDREKRRRPPESAGSVHLLLAFPDAPFTVRAAPRRSSNESLFFSEP